MEPKRDNRFEKPEENVGQPKLFPDSRTQFERACDAAVKSGSKHRPRPKDERKERPASKGRVHKGKSRS
jgi:hypothetical protein